MARTKKTREMTTEVAKEIAEKIDWFEEQATQGSFVPHGCQDVLAAAIGRPEHPGRVCAAGAGVSIKQYFGSAPRTSRSASSLPLDELQQLTQQIRDQLEESITEKVTRQVMASFSQLQSQMQSQAPPEPLVGPGPSGPRVSTKGSCVDPSGNDPETGDSDRCGLYIEADPARLVVVGRVYEGLTLVHNTPLLPSQVKVSVDKVKDADAPVPVPTAEVSLVGQALHTFLAWPTHLIKSLSHQVAVSPPKPPPKPDPEVDDPLYLMTLTIPELFLRPYQVRWDATVFGVVNLDFPLYIKHEDLSKIAHGGQCLSISVLQLWILHLTETCMRAGNSDIYGFLEPQSIQRSGQSQFEFESYIRSWMQSSQRDVYLGAYLNGPDNYLKRIINSAIKGLDDAPQPKSKAPARWIVVKCGVLISCGGFPNVPLMGTRGCISYNPNLAIRQLGYPMRGAPLEEELTPVISRGFNKTNMETLLKVRKAWEVVQKKDKELRGSNNGPSGGYREWLKAHVQGLDWLPSLRTAKREEVEAPEEDEEVQDLRIELEQAQTVKERFKSVALRIQKENAKLRDVNVATTKALEQETKRARKEEHGRNNYNPVLAIRQLGYPMRGEPLEDELMPIISRGLDWLPSLRTAKREEVEATEEDEEVQTLRAELKQAQTVKEREKHGQNKFRGALWGSNHELKLRREERDQSRVDILILKDELKACSRSKRSLSQRLCEAETNMLAIISKYQEEQSLAMAHEHRVADEYAQVYAEKEARGRVIDSLHQEATMWMDQFALTLNGSQELPRLLAKAKAMADTYSAPEEVHGRLGYCQHMIDLMAHIIRNR
ncbi:hypothetical protein GmHk_05G012931 [Glycine max]|nr:hypothetical protein GmHk_05G012931 [Glycine max]